MKWILIFLCLPAFGQLPVLPFAPSASSTPGPQSIPGLAFYWVSSDMVIGGSVSNWTDRIQGAIWTNTSSAWPTNSALGVHFDGSAQWLTNKVLKTANSDGCTIWMILKPETVIGGGSSGLSSILQDSGEFGCYFFDSGGNVTCGFGAKFKGISGIMTDWILDNSSALGHAYYTNAVIANNSPGTFASGTFERFLAYDTDVNTSKYRGYIAEIGWYTNAISTNSAWVNTLHNYAKAIYSVTP